MMLPLSPSLPSFLPLTLPPSLSKVYTDREGMLAGALKLAETIASKSPGAIQVAKTIFYYRDITDFMASRDTGQHDVWVPLWLYVPLLSYLIYILSK